VIGVKLIRVDDNVYRALTRIVGELTVRTGKRASFNDAVRYLLRNHEEEKNTEVEMDSSGDDPEKIREKARSVLSYYFNYTPLVLHDDEKVKKFAENFSRKYRNKKVARKIFLETVEELRGKKGKSG